MAISTTQAIGSYDLVALIAEGGMGAVYKARHQQTGQIVAIKVVPPHLTKNTVMMKRFEQEYNAAHTIDDPSIVRALEFGHNGVSPYLVMEFVEGESLGQRLDRVHHLPESEAIRIIVQAAKGLQRAHALGLIHRDVKPDNLLLTPEGQVKLADLGLVKEIDADLNLTRTGRGLGTPHFMAPEQFRNAKNADARCDIYSLGATLYMMVTGELPFKACGPLDAWMKKLHNELTPARELMPTLSDRLDHVIRRAMSPDPNQRPSNCREFIESLTGQNTRKLTPIAAEPSTDIWYLVYKDDEGMMHTVKGTMPAIRRSFKEGLLGDASNVRLSRSKAGPFEPLRVHEEFRDLVAVSIPTPIALPAQTPPPTNRNRPPMLPPLMPESKKPERPKAPVASPSKQPVAPHIRLGPVGGQPEWLRWLTVIVVALASAISGYFLLPFLSGLRFPW